VQITLDSKRLDLTFASCLLLTLIQPVWFPHLRLLFFVPFLVVAFYQKPLKTCLWLAVICGLFSDLLSAYSRLGVHSLSFCLTTFLIYSQRRNFFADNLSTLPIMTFLFSSLSTLILGIAWYSIEMQSVFSWSWAFSDLLILPAADALYAFICFILPGILFGKRQRRGKDYFLHS